MKSFPLSLFVASFALCSTSGFSQTSSQEILVTANRVPQPANVIMAATTVIDRETIRRSLAQNLVELLSGLPGMQLAPSGGLGAQTSLFLRGTDSDHTLILIDGVQVSTSTGAAGRLEFIPLDQIQRIEIVRGPRSSIYGSEAIGGVMNIITTATVEQDFAGNMSLMAGTENSSNANFGISGRTGNTSLALDASSRQTDGISAANNGNSDDDGYENDSMALSMTHGFSDTIGFTASYSAFDTKSDYDDGEVDGESQQFALGLDFLLTENWRSSLNVERFTEDNDDVGAFGTTNSHSENSEFSWRNTLALNLANTLAFGVDLQEQKLEYSSFGAVQTDTSRDNNGIYGVLLHEGAVADLTVSLRNDDNERFGNHATGSIALGRDFTEDLRAWISYGTAFKAPNLIDLYVDFPSFFYFANPDLEPETSKNLELGLQGAATGVQWQLNVFRNEIEDLITTDATFTTLANVQEARINGIEASIATEVAEWQLSLALTALEHENRNTGNPLLRRPDETLALNIARDFGNFDVGLNLLAQSEHADLNPVTFGSSTVGGYALANLVAGYRISNAMNLRLRIGNLFDRDYQIVDGFNTYGRTAQLSFDYSF